MSKRNDFSDWQNKIHHASMNNETKERPICGLCGNKYIKTQGDDQDVCLLCINAALEHGYVSRKRFACDPQKLPWWLSRVMLGESEYAYLFN
jgi:hypothetical protein